MSPSSSGIEAEPLALTEGEIPFQELFFFFSNVFNEIRCRCKEMLLSAAKITASSIVSFFTSSKEKAKLKTKEKKIVNKNTFFKIKSSILLVYCINNLFTK